MTEMNKLNVESLEEVTGGAVRTVHNSSVNYANVRREPGLDGPIAGKVYNGTKLITTGKKSKKDGYVWYEVTLEGGSDYAWIAGSLIGY